MTESLGMKLSKVLLANEPGLLVCNPEASARAAAEVSNLLGCIMATVLKKYPEQYEAAFKGVCYKIHESACKTADAADRIIPNITPH